MGGNNRSLEGLSQILDLMSRAVRTCQVYPPGHDLRSTFLVQLHRELGKYLEEAGRLECRIEELGLYDLTGHLVFQGRREDLFPWALYKNGIRGLSLYQGLTYKELEGFVNLMVEYPDDLLYFLLEEDMPHISFEVAEYAVLDEEVEVPQGDGEVSEEPLSFSDAYPVSADVPEDVTLTQEDIAYLDRELEAEEKRDYLSYYLDLILKVFPMEGYADVAEDFIKGLGTLALESLGWGDIFLSLTLTKRFRELLKKGNLDPERTAQVVEVLETLRSSKTLDLIKENYSPSWGSNLRELLVLLDPANVDGVLEWLEEENREEVRDALLHFLWEKVKARPSRLVTYFSRGGPGVKREMVLLAGRLEGEEGKRVLDMALESGLEDVKREALKVVLKLEPDALEGLAGRFLESESSEIRALLFDAVLESGGVPSVAPLLSREVAKEGFVFRGYLEKRLHFSALALSDRVLFIETLKGLLISLPGWKSRKKWGESLEVAFNVALDSGDMGFRELEGLVRASGNRRALKVWERLVRAREGVR